MTIAVGAKYPRGDLNRLPPPSSKIPEAVILASDSRFSRKLAGSYVPSSDIGAKVFQLGGDAAAAYAGISKVGEECLDELRWKLSRQSESSSASSREIAQQTFQAVYKHHVALMKLRPDDAPLYILIGTCNKRSQSELYKASYNTDFKLEPVTGLNALAWPETKDRFNNLLSNELHKQVEDQLSLWVPMPIQAEHVAMLITAILNNIIESGSDRTIGGMVQCALVTSEGVSLPEISLSTDPTNEGPGWTRATAKPSELTTVTGISGLFGFYHLSD